ncbi:MAG TPA: hypothetical protein ENN06_05800 [Desulfobacteraceae bacterium]|nr:hypothetical protein [Desulfobacteraceae bacterium]
MSADINAEAIRLFRSWLRSDRGYRHLVRTAGSIFREASRHGGLKTVLPYDLRTGLSDEARKDIEEEIAHDFLVFLLDEFIPAIGFDSSLMQDLVNGRPHIVLQYGWHRFIGRWKDRSRSRELNPRGYLYRRVRELVAGSDQFITTGQQSGCVAYAPAMRPHPPSGKVWAGGDESSGGWPAPGMSGKKAGENEIYTSRFLLPAALFFHKEVAKAAGENIYVPVREFVRYLSFHFPWLNRSWASELPEDDSFRNDADSGGRGMGMEEAMDRRSAFSSIAALSDQLMSSLTVEECRVLVLKVENPSMPFREIAGQLGHPDHNHVYRLYHRGLATIKRFCDNWPGPPPDELPEEVKKHFMEEVLKRCKKRLSCP